ncbi:MULTISPECIES: sugar phosphate isomerase/epimerase [unclassified Arthrobacter]|uniref:sugar phosphate isomerase/epimerase family protein n=1 Tax=unclassified Arthrobacter TaxID=235627 RepID=UPI001C864B4D|nr:TIM barrel protein [Arthrobacter sp. MAHUQ-56]MBX7445929.1 sugar phosphate isomerase/epimerase [Arthrobacter sp. MAHUQ-56]
MSLPAQPTLGVTLYSFNHEWVTARFTLEGLLKAVAEAGIGPGIEIVGFQSIRNFPHLEPGFAAHFRATLEENGLVQTSMGSVIDTAMRRDRYLTLEERAEYLAPQIQAAHDLGFPLVRIQLGAEPEVLERVVPLAERLGIRLGMEIHAPEGPNTEAVLKVREAYDRIGSEMLGFVPDFSSSMKRITPGLLDSFVRDGLNPQLVTPLEEIWAEKGDPGERLGRFRELAKERGATDAEIEMVTPAFTINGHINPAEWGDIVDQIFHVHAKFYSIDEHGKEPSIDYLANLAPLRDAGYSGTISSEWEAHPWTPEAEMDTFGLIQSQQALIRSVFQR